MVLLRTTKARGRRAAKPDKITREWIRNKSDERAAAAGHRFDPARAAHVCNFFEHDLRLYEGDHAGQPFALIDWQRDFLSRAFGWIYYSDEWNREVRRFRKTAVWVPKKNGKSPLAAGCGLYLLCMDGEKGQKVYSAARDGRQADIVHLHARKMTKSSAAIYAECTINNTTGQICHVPTDSYYSRISADNINSQEGLNGSVIIDEGHVVDSRLAAVLEYAGASRSEPLQMIFSTAGNDPQSWGKKEFDYGLSVERGEADDLHYLFIGYFVDEKATEEQLASPKTWEKANPSWPHIIKPSEMSRTFGEAQRKGPSALAKWSMYRLNQWQQASSQWLDYHRWIGCGDAKLDILRTYKGAEAAFGLDLSKTRDMSALASTIPLEDEQFALHVDLWITERYVHQHGEGTKDNIAFREWADRGWLTIVPGNTIKESLIRRRFRQLCEWFAPLCLIYDKTYAAAFVEWIEDENLILDDSHARKRIRLPEDFCVELPQTAGHMERPIDDFEAIVTDGRLVHGRNACLDWQAGHVKVRENHRGYRILCKPDGKNDPKKIDGIQAAVMATWGATTTEAAPESVYKRRGVIAV